MATTGTIHPRQLPQSCLPPSARGPFGDEASALADSPNFGEIYEIDGEFFYYDGADFQPLIPPGDHVLIPDTEFADPLNPTQAEVDAFIDTQTDARHHTNFYVVGDGSVDEPDYVWSLDAENDVNRLIQSVSVITRPLAFLDVHSIIPNLVTGGLNSFTNIPGTTITDYEWTVTNLNTGVVVYNINGAEGVDASGETGVKDGTYDTPKWDINDTCTPFQFDLAVTDSEGNVSDTVSAIITRGGTEVDLVFTHDATAQANVVIDLSFSDDYVAQFDMGDGTIIDSNNINHTYTATGDQTITATVCSDTLLEVIASDNALSGSIEDIFAGDMSLFPILQRYIFDNNSLTGTVPDASNNPLMIEMSADNNQLSGTPPNTAGADSLETYSFNNNSMTGDLPEIDGNLALVTFDLGDNLLTDADWHDTTGNTEITYYDIGGNSITGNTQDYGGVGWEQILTKTGLVHYDISGNNISGEAFLLQGYSLLSLEYFDISDNNLTATWILGTLLGHPSLIYFDASNLSIGGEHPSIANQVDMEYFDISNNLLTGEARPTTTNTVLIYYNAANNDLTSPAGGLDRSTNGNLETLRFDGNPSMVYIPGDITAANRALLDIRYDSTATVAPDSDTLYCDVEAAVVAGGQTGGIIGTTTVPPGLSAEEACWSTLTVGFGWSRIVA